MKDDESLRSYLLGALDEKQVDELEQRLLAEGELFLLAEAMEGDLLAAAARGDLSSPERGRVLRRLAASPGGRARYALAHGLTSIGREVSAEVLVFRLLARPEVRAAAVAATLVFTAGGFWLATQTAMPGPGSGANMIARARPAASAPEIPAQQQMRPSPAMPPAMPPGEQIAEQAPAPVAPPPAGHEPSIRPEPAPLILQLALTTVRSAGGDLPRLEIRPETRQIEIRLPLMHGEPSTAFAAILRNASTDEEIWREERMAASEVDGRRVLVLSVPATALAPGIYQVEVRAPEGDELLGQPTFEVASTNSPSRASGDGIQ
jgi:hypothetical protein